MTQKRGKSSHLFQKTFPATEIGEREEEEESICENAGMSLSKGTERKQYSCCYLAEVGVGCQQLPKNTDFLPYQSACQP